MWGRCQELSQARDSELKGHKEPCHLLAHHCGLSSAPAAFSHADNEPQDILSVFLEASTEMREQGLAPGPLELPVRGGASLLPALARRWGRHLGHLSLLQGDCHPRHTRL